MNQKLDGVFLFELEENGEIERIILKKNKKKKKNFRLNFHILFEENEMRKVSDVVICLMKVTQSLLDLLSSDRLAYYIHKYFSSFHRAALL